MFDIHPSAKQTFDTRARELLKSLEEYHLEKSEAFVDSKGDIHVSAIVTDDDLLAQPKLSVVDYDGNIIARFFVDGGKKYGLSSSNHVSLVKLSESIQALKAFSDKISQNFIEETLFKWLKDSFTKVNKDYSFIDALINEASVAIQPIRVTIPLSNLIVNRPFEFCGAIIKNLYKSVFDEIVSNSRSHLDTSTSLNVETLVKKLRIKYQGYASVEMELLC